MYKRVALFSSDLLADSIDDQSLRENIERQINKVYGDDFSDEYPNHSEKYSPRLLNSQNTTTDCTESLEDSFAGKFKCILCPKKIIINDSDLEKHLKSKQHIKKVEIWQKEQANARKIREKFNILHNLTDLNDNFDEINSENTGTPELNVAKQYISKKNKSKSKHSNLSEEQIKARKIKFMRKKERRLARKSQLNKSIC